MAANQVKPKYQLIIKGLDTGIQILNLEVNKKQFMMTTVKELKEIMITQLGLKVQFQQIELYFKTEILANDNSLNSYGIKNGNILKSLIVLSVPCNIMFQETIINIGVNGDPLKTTTVRRLKEIITAMDDFGKIFENTKLKFNDVVLEDERTLDFYKIHNGSEIEAEKYYNPYSFRLHLTKAPDAIAGNNSGQFRALLSCGHAVDPNSLTTYCRNLINQGQSEFTCPALVNRTNKMCNKQWDFEEVKKLVLLNKREMVYFGARINELRHAEYINFKECPNCHSTIERLDLTNLRVECAYCEQEYDQYFEFCWQCEREWTVPIETASDSCGRDNCPSSDLVVLKAAKLVRLEDVEGLKPVPSIRACPTCGTCCEHDKTQCKNLTCELCHVSFCFACLELTSVCSRTSNAYEPCSKPVAEIQQRIPGRRRERPYY